MWRETFGAALTADACGERVPIRDRYDLATALHIVRRMESSATRGAVFAEITRKNPLYRLVDRIYAKAGARVLQPLALFLYMLKCTLAVGPSHPAGPRAVTLSNFANETHSIDRVAALIPDVPLLRLSLKRGHTAGRGQLRAAGRMLASGPRIWRFLSTLAGRHSFMPAARIASALAFYMRFTRLFADQPQLVAAITASNYSPEAVGLAAAAHRFGRRVIYVNHAPVAANGSVVQPVFADCAVFYGDAIRQAYEKRSRCTAEVALIGQPWTARPMEWREQIRTIGIFLTALTRPDAVSALVAAIRVSHPEARILIRNHPVALLKCDFSAIEAEDGKLEVTIGKPLDDEMIACDLIVCGNSGVAMNALSGGRPVAYMDTLDGLDFDYIGFVGSGLLCHVPRWDDDVQAKLKEFYCRPRWHEIMRSYDASYGADVEALNQAAAVTISRYLNPISGSN
jgi:hypothetical protein